MLWKNRNKRVGLCVMVVTSCLVLAAVWVVLATPGTALAAKPDKPGKPGGGEVGQLIPVCIAFDDTGGIRNDQTDSEGGIPYCDGESKKKVTAIVGRNFSIVLGSNNSNKRTAGRTIWLDLSGGLGCAGSIGVDVSDGTGGDVDGICDECFDSVPDLPIERFGTLPSNQKFGYPDNAKLEILGRDLDGLLVGNTVETNARLSFSVGGQSWILHWGPHKIKVPGGWTYAPSTAPVIVERVDLNTWQITSTGDACLYRDNNPPHRATEYHGQVSVPFGLTAVAMESEETVWGDEPWGIELGVLPCVD